MGTIRFPPAGDINTIVEGSQGSPSLRVKTAKDRDETRLGPTLFAYILRAALPPVLLALAMLVAAVLAKDMLGFSDLVINRGLRALTVARLGFYEAVPIAGRTLPFALVIGLLVALGGLASNREFVALEACGVSPRYLIGPVVALAAGATVVGQLISVYALPWAERSRADLLDRVARERPESSIRPGAVAHFGDWKLQAREVSSSGEQLRGALVWMPDAGETIFAREGHLDHGPDGAIHLVLERGEVLLRSSREPRIIRFGVMRAELPRPDPFAGLDRDAPLEGLGLAQLSALARASGSDTGVARRAAVELQRRLALPCASLAFGFLALPLLLAMSRPSAAGGAVLGLLLTVAYYGLVQLGDGLVSGGELGVIAGAWLPNAAIVLVGGVLLARGERFDERTGVRAEARVRRGAMRVRRHPLERSVAREFAELTLLSLGALVAGYLITDVLERLDWLARHHATLPVALRFYAVRTPLLVSRMVPMAFLAGTALMVSRLAARGELTAMRASGIPALRGLLPLLLVAIVAVPIDFVLNDSVIPRTNALADRIKTEEIKRESRGLENSIWYRSGNRLYHAARMDPTVGTAEGLHVYQIGADGLPAARTDAARARYVGDGLWALEDPRRIEISTRGIREVEAPKTLALGLEPPAEVDTMHLGVRDLEREIRETEQGGYDATRFRVDLNLKLAAPFACVALPAVALMLAISGPPFPPTAVILLASGALGIGYVLVSGIFAALGYGGVLPPVVAGWGSTILPLLLAILLGVRGRG